MIMGVIASLFTTFAGQGYEIDLFADGTHFAHAMRSQALFMGKVYTRCDKGSRHNLSQNAKATGAHARE